MKIEANGISINYEIEGPEGAPWVTFSNSLASNLHMWDEQAAILKENYRVLRYDQRGHGKTDAPAGGYTFPMLMDDVMALWDALGVEKSHWVGLSLGGMTAYGLGIHNGDRLLSFIAADSRPTAPPDYANYFQSRIDMTNDGGMESLVRPTIERWFVSDFVEGWPPVLDKVADMIRSTDPTGHIGCCEALKTLAFGDRIHEIKTPAMVIGGEKDKGAPPDVLGEAAAAIPGGKHVVVPNAGHISNLENPSAFNDAMVAFINENS